MNKSKWQKKLGPGLITGAADDDPSGIATYSQGGAQFGYNMLWTLFLTYPLMIAIQLISARIGMVAGIILGFSSIDPIKALYWSAVINGIISIPIMTVMLIMASKKSIMGNFIIGKVLKTFGWVTAIIMAIAVVLMFWSILKVR